jgi:hypothetical protein
MRSNFQHQVQYHPAWFHCGWAAQDVKRAILGWPWTPEVALTNTLATFFSKHINVATLQCRMKITNRFLDFDPAHQENLQ